jgi:hypothetical protein
MRYLEQIDLLDKIEDIKEVMKSGNSEDREYNGHQEKDRECNDQQKDRECNGQQEKDREYNDQQKDGEYNGQQEKDRECNGQQEKDGEYNGQQEKDREYNGQQEKDRDYNGHQKNNDRQNITHTLMGRKYFHTKIFPYIFHIKPLIFNTFSCSHSLSDFHEIFNIKPQNKYSFFFL